ncbi:hypothetical protein [Alsobacter sp. R-9]
MFRAFFLRVFPVLFGLAATGSVAGASAQTPEARSAPVIAYVAPPELVRLELWSQGEPQTYVWPFKPMPAYDRPNGKRIGTFIGSDPPATENGGGGMGDVRLQIGFPRVKRELGVNLDMWSYDVYGLTTEDEPLVEGEFTWSRIVPWHEGKRVPADAVWIKTPTKDVHSYFDRATYLEGIDVWCERPGVCRTAPQKLKDLIAKLNDDFGAYTLKAIRTSSGIYYRMDVRKNPAPTIPKDMQTFVEGFFPAFRPDGTHVGQFYPKGC